MTIYDAVMAGIVAAGMVWGAWRGITWQVASIASLVLGYAVAFPASGQLAAHLPGTPIVARAAAMLALYVATSGGVFLIAWLIRATLRAMKFEAYDRHLGMILGGLEGAILAVVGTLFVLSLAPQSRLPILSSPSGRVVSTTLEAVQPALPGEVRSMLAPFWSSEASPGEVESASPTATRPHLSSLLGSLQAAEASPPQPMTRAQATQSERADGVVSDWTRSQRDRIGRAVVDSVAETFEQQAGDSHVRNAPRR